MQLSQSLARKARSKLPLALVSLAALHARAVAKADTPAVSAAQASPEPASEALTNKRMQAVEGSLSPWSGQFNLLYKGSTVAHPFSEEAPNPGHAVPPPVVTLSGTVSTRYRFSQQTTAGFGSGVTTETPFEGPKHTTLADPYVDLAHSFVLGGLRHRVDLQLTQWTNHSYYKVYGYRQGVNLLAESLYTFTSGLTLGWQIAVDGNLFANGAYDERQQTQYGFGFYPSLEYPINRYFDLRTVIGVRDAHSRSLDSLTRFQRPDPYQTVGLGFTLERALYVYLFAKVYPYSEKRITAERTLCGFSTVINLF